MTEGLLIFLIGQAIALVGGIIAVVYKFSKVEAKVESNKELFNREIQAITNSQTQLHSIHEEGLTRLESALRLHIEKSDARDGEMRGIRDLLIEVKTKLDNGIR